MQERAPLFSVTITTYKHEDYIKSTIESVLRQTIQDFEIIVIDDGSPDNTSQKVLGIKDRRIKYFRLGPSGLPACSRNRGVERARGRYIALLDGDDTWLPEKLKKSLEAFRKYPEIDIICHDLRMRGRNLKHERCTLYGPYPENMYEKLLFEGNCLGISATVLKREIFFRHNFWFDEDRGLFAVEDYDFWLRLAESKLFNFYYLPEVLAEHVVSEESAILQNIEKSGLNTLLLFDRNMKKHGFGKSKKFSIARKRRSSMMRSIALSHNYRREFRRSAAWFLKALAEYPFSKNNYIGLASSLLRIRLGRI